jgi:diamine N-acetyltransferase
MIDREHQGKGYGRAAMQAVIAMMADRVGCDEIVTSFVPANTVAAAL